MMKSYNKQNSMNCAALACAVSASAGSPCFSGIAVSIPLIN